MQLPATAAGETAGHSGYSFPTPGLKVGRLSWGPPEIMSTSGRVAWVDKSEPGILVQFKSFLFEQDSEPLYFCEFTLRLIINRFCINCVLFILEDQTVHNTRF